ncbi:MAG: hypothetical protein P8Y66_06340 [Nitrospirota bacterium]
MIRGKNLKAIAFDIAEGYVTVNPIFLKPLDEETIKGLLQEVGRAQAAMRAAAFPTGDIQGIRMRNMKLQRLHTASMVIRNYAKQRRMRIY